MNRVFIVAEIGCNHNGNKEQAYKMIDEAKACGVDAVKFQMFTAKDFISCCAPKADYQKDATGIFDSQLEMTEKLELSRDAFIELKAYGERLGLVVFSTPFDIGSVEFLDSIGQKLWKIPSGEITNLPYLEKIGRIIRDGRKVVVSSGMATIDELKECLDILAKAGTSEKDVILLHCNTAYPTPDEDVNIFVIQDLKNNFPNISIGFSDHSVGCVAAIGATVLGISLIEKHFTLDKSLKGPDHKASATPLELKALVENVRRMEAMACGSKKMVTESERNNKTAARKSIVALRNIKAGEVLSEDNITCKRPGNGISPMHWHDVLGKIAERNFVEDELVELAGFEWQGQ